MPFTSGPKTQTTQEFGRSRIADAYMWPVQTVQTVNGAIGNVEEDEMTKKVRFFAGVEIDKDEKRHKIGRAHV